MMWHIAFWPLLATMIGATYALTLEPCKLCTYQRVMSVPFVAGADEP